MRHLEGLQGTLVAVPPPLCIVLVVLLLIVYTQWLRTEKEQILAYLAV